MHSARAKKARSRAYAAILLALTAALPLTMLQACSEDGETPKCPPQILRDISAEEGDGGAAGASADAEAQAMAIAEAREAAIDAGCLTPIGSATSSPPPGTGGSTNTGGSAGRGGSSGSNAAAGAGGV